MIFKKIKIAFLMPFYFLRFFTISQEEPVSDNYVQIENYYADILYGNDQWIVDKANTAARFSFFGRDIIADHSYQGFGIIRTANTAIVDGLTYHLVSRYYGDWGQCSEGDTIYLEDGRHFVDCYDGELIMYTCTGPGATVTYWTIDKNTNISEENKIEESEIIENITEKINTENQIVFVDYSAEVQNLDKQNDNYKEENIKIKSSKRLLGKIKKND